MGLVDGKVAVVSGCGPGLGREVALAMAREGADLVLVSRSDETTRETADDVEQLGRQVLSVRCDVTVASDCERVAVVARERLGRVDILVNNAFLEGRYSTVVDADLEFWHDMMECNYFGALHMIRSLTPLLRESGDGRIINVNTLQSIWARPTFGGYAASKAALATITKTLARELGPMGIRVNGVHPSLIWNDVAENWLRSKAEKRGVAYDDIYSETVAETCLGYIPGAGEVSGSILFLASDLAKPVTGQWWVVDCGRYIP